MKDYQNAIIIGSLLIVTFIASVLLLVFGSSWDRRVIFFPHERGEGFYGEYRTVPSRRTREAQMELLLEESLLGPVNIDNRLFLPRETDVRSFLYRDGIVYIDFSHEAISLQNRNDFNIDTAMQVIERTFRYNFKGIREIVFTIMGQLPGEPAFILEQPVTED
ncbi:MAG: GerMN domain-containing protein [Spirochaetia bacterium]